MGNKRYNSESWVDPRIEVKSSSIQGKGMFARDLIKRGEKVIVWGGNIMTKENIKNGEHRRHSAVEIKEGVYLADFVTDPPEIDDFTNHSCDPNLWMEDEITLTARKDILPGDELTIDYAMICGDLDWLSFQCNCGSSQCRKKNNWE